MLRGALSRVFPPPPGSTDREPANQTSHTQSNWGARALLALAAALYLAGRQLTPFEPIDAWIDARLFWEPIAAALVLLLLVLLVDQHRQQRQTTAGSRSAPVRASSEFQICVGCKAVRQQQKRWSPIEAFLADRTADTFTRSICPDCRDLAPGELIEPRSR